MQHNNNQRRQRPRGNNNNHNNGPRRPNMNSSGNGTYNRNQTFDSNGPDVRVRGTAQQVYERYLNSARDASAVGDHIRAESLMQHAEHYYRIVASITPAVSENFQAQNEHSGNAHGNQQRMDQPSSQQSHLSEEQPSITGAAFPQQQQPQHNNSQNSQQSAPRQHRPRGGYVPPMPPAASMTPAFGAEDTNTESQPAISDMPQPVIQPLPHAPEKAEPSESAFSSAMDEQPSVAVIPPEDMAPPAPPRAPRGRPRREFVPPAAAVSDDVPKSQPPEDQNNPASEE